MVTLGPAAAQPLCAGRRHTRRRVPRTRSAGPLTAARQVLLGDVDVGALAEATEGGVTVRIARAPGHKCERCWHYSEDIGAHPSHPTLCGRCVTVLEAPQAGR